MKNENRLTEVISFRKGDRLATVVTDGNNHRSYELEQCKSHRSLHMAISYLEAMGYEIDMDTFNGL